MTTEKGCSEWNGDPGRDSGTSACDVAPAPISAEQQIAAILLAEDNDGHAVLIERNLRTAGVVNTVCRVCGGDEVLAFVSARTNGGRDAEHTLLIILDLSLPGVDGFEVLRRLKNNPEHRSIPVAVLTTSVNPEDISRCRALGCDAYSDKWTAFADFRSFVRQLASLAKIVLRPGISGADS